MLQNYSTYAYVKINFALTGNRTVTPRGLLGKLNTTTCNYYVQERFSLKAYDQKRLWMFQYNVF